MPRKSKAPAPKRQRGEDGAGKPVAKKKVVKNGGGRRRNEEKDYWAKMGAEFEISSEEDKDVWSDSDEDEMHGDEFEAAGEEEQDTAAAIVQRWKQAQQAQQAKGEKRKLSDVTAADDDEEEEEEELKDEFDVEEDGGEADGENAETGGDENGDEDEEDEEEGEDVPRVRKGPGSVSFAMVLGQLLSPEGGSTEAAAPEEEQSAQPAAADPILKNFKKRTNKKLEAERRRRREARELALKKKLLKARDHRIPTVLNEPAEARLRKLATKGVVQLFNVVRKQQKIMTEENTEELEKRNPVKAEKLSKTKFLELLQKTGQKAGSRTVKNEEDAVKQEEQAKPQWDVLSDDYMLGAALKDMPDEDADE